MPSASEIIATDPTHPLFSQEMAKQLGYLRKIIVDCERDVANAWLQVEKLKQQVANAKDNYTTLVAGTRDANGKQLYSNEFSRDAAVNDYLLNDEDYIKALAELLRWRHDLRLCEINAASTAQARTDLLAVLAHATAYVQYLARG